MGRSILVLGVPRSGTSAVAGALHHLGVDMGTGHLQQGNEWNPRGYYEDLRWQKLNKAITGPRYGHEQPTAISVERVEQYRALAELCDTNFLWGMKDPRLCFTAPFIWVWLQEPRIIAVKRSAEASAASLMRHSQENYNGRYAMSLQQARALINVWSVAMAERLRQFHGPSIKVHYEELVNSPEDVLYDLGRFSFHGLRELQPDYKAARAFIEPELNHYD
jgi:hypothetical protein